MTKSFDKKLDAAFDGQSVAQLLNASPAALNGVTDADAQHLDDAFRVQTIRDLANLKYARWARAILAAGGVPRFDPGPPPSWESFLLDEAPLAHYVNHPSHRFRLDFGPVYYRGRLDGSARVIVVGQDPATNEILAQRAFVGNSGQLVQSLLNKIGITRSYIMVNTFLFSIFGQIDATMRSISLEPEVMGFRNEFLDRLVAECNIQGIIAAGNGAQHAVDNWANMPAGLARFDIQHPAAPSAAPSWNAALPGLTGAVDPDDDGVVDNTLYGATLTAADRVDIPRFDLAFGIPDWHGAGGGHATRDGDKEIRWLAP